jgi:hypothetical protein
MTQTREPSAGAWTCWDRRRHPRRKVDRRSRRRTRRSGREAGTLCTIVALALLLAGCGSVNRVVVLQHPDTKQTVQCKVNPWGPFDRTGQIESCVRAYEEAGYRTVGDSH